MDTIKVSASVGWSRRVIARSRTSILDWQICFRLLGSRTEFSRRRSKMDKKKNKTLTAFRSESVFYSGACTTVILFLKDILFGSFGNLRAKVCIPAIDGAYTGDQIFPDHILKDITVCTHL